MNAAPTQNAGAAARATGCELQLPTMAELRRTHTIEEIIAAPIGEAATLMGWVHYRRDLGQLIFITLRDRWGELQCVCDPADHPDAH